MSLLRTMRLKPMKAYDRQATSSVKARELSEPDSSELDRIYLLGYDAWGEAAGVDDYLSGCRASDKYEQGRWHTLTVDDQIVSALIVHADGFHLPDGFQGIGSVATDERYRGQGHASTLIKHVVATLETRGSKGVYLFSDIPPRFYQRLGFVTLGMVGGSTCMLRVSARSATDDALRILQSAMLPGSRSDNVPDYF